MEISTQSEINTTSNPGRSNKLTTTTGQGGSRVLDDTFFPSLESADPPQSADGETAGLVPFRPPNTTPPTTTQQSHESPEVPTADGVSSPLDAGARASEFTDVTDSEKEPINCDVRGVEATGARPKRRAAIQSRKHWLNLHGRDLI